MAIGVFGLQVAYKLKRLEVMSLDDTHGWFGGGTIPGPANTSTVDRIDFSNDTGTANIRGSLASARYRLSATGNSNYGWFGGGTTPAPITFYSTVDRIDFSNDSVSASVRGPLSLARGNLAATGNSNYGWFGGGYDPGTIRVSTVDRIDFSNDIGIANIRGPLSLIKLSLSVTGNSNYGWFGGGTVPGTPIPAISGVDRVDFSNDSPTASPRGPLSVARSSLAATGNSNYGWFGGGTSISLGTISTIDRIDFSNDSSTASVRCLLSSVRRQLSTTGNSNYGWFGGGSGPGIPVPSFTTIDRIDFSNDTVTASPRGPLSLARAGSGATSGQAKGPAIKLQKGGNFGWFGGGRSGTPLATLSTVNRIDFSNDSATASPRSPLSSVRDSSAATGNSNYGWFGGGYNPSVTPSPVSTVDRIDFSNDSSTASVRGSLFTARSGLSATGNSNYGWFGGGYGTPAPGFRSSIDRIDFSNDSSAASQRGLLFTTRTGSTSTGNSNYGWFGGGISPGPSTVSTVDRIDFSNDSSTASIRGSLSLVKQQLAATGNSNYGWFGGGQSGGTGYTTVDRIDFSNDSSTTSPRGPLSSARYRLAATGNSNYGWFGGGNTPPVATVDRINFSNDSVTASVRGSLFAVRQQHAATSNTPS
jgi:hypothetical protein